MGITNRARRAREEQDKLVEAYLARHPERAERVARMRRSWFGRMVIIEWLNQEAHH